MADPDGTTLRRQAGVGWDSDIAGAGGMVATEDSVAGYSYLNRVVVHVGAGSAARRWPPRRWAALTERLTGRGLHPVLTGSLEDRPAAEHVIAHALDLLEDAQAALHGGADLKADPAGEGPAQRPA